MKEVWTIRGILLEDGMSFNSTLQDLTKEMQRKFNKYWENPNLMLILACVFYPRSKLTFIDFCFRVAYGDESNEYNKRWQEMNSSLKKFYEEYETISSDRATSSESPQVESRTVGKMKLEMSYSQFKSQNRHLRLKRSELDNYLEELEIESNEEIFDILQLWKRNSDLYPTLAKMARDFLAIQVSTIAFESAFSVAGQLMDHLRSSMNDETIEALVCSKDWFASIDGRFELGKFRPFMQIP